MRSLSQKQKDIILSIGISSIGVSLLVGNAYMVNNVGYPSAFQYIGIGIMMVSFIFAIIPFIVYLMLEKFGIAMPLQRRESFIESNILLWVYSALIYSLLIFIFIQHKRKVGNNKLNNNAMK